MVRRVYAISQNLTKQLTDKVTTFRWYSIALGESTDICDTTQLLILNFIRGIGEGFSITEELLSMESLKDTTTGQD